MSSTSNPARTDEQAGSGDPSRIFSRLNRRDVGALLFLFVANLAFFWPMIRPWGRWYIVQGDFSNQFFPFRAFAAAEWWSGRIPLWNPDMLAGHPFVADIQTAVFYPPAFINAIVFGRLGQNGFPFSALEGEVILHTFLAAAFTYVLARKLSGSFVGALVAALAFGFGGFITSYPAQQLAMLETAVWLPLLVLCLEFAFEAGLQRRWIAAAGFVYGISILAGHPQTDLFIAYAAGGYLLWRLFWNRVPLARALTAVVLFAACALGLAAIQILPTVDFLRRSIRTHMNFIEAAHGYAVSSLPEIFVPLWHGEKALSVGVAALFFAVVGAWAARREPVIYWAVVGLIAIPLSTGGATPLFWFLYTFVPGWDLFRDQERVIYVFSFAAAILAARGVAWIERGYALKAAKSFISWLRVSWFLAALAGLLALVLTFAGGSLGTPMALRDNLALDAIVLASLAVTLRLARRVAIRTPNSLPARGLPNWINAALVLIVLGECFAINFGNNLGPTSPDARPRLAATAAFLRDYPEPFRVRGISEKVFPSDYGAMLGLPTIGGDTPFLDRRMDEMLNADADWRVWQILNVKFFLSDGPALAGMTLAFQDGNLKTYAVQDSLPRAWAVRAVEVAKSPAEAKQMILAPGYYPGNIVVLEKPTSLGPFVPGPRPDVKITHLDPQRIDIDANGNGNAMLVIADRYDPDWQAFRDGVPVPTFRANYLATALELPPGPHHFELVYRPLAFYVGAGISAVTLLVALGFAFADEKVRRVLVRSQVRFKVGQAVWAGAVAILVIGGFALRVHAIGQPTLTNDEWFMLRNYDEGPLWIIHQAHTFEPHPLLYYLGLAGWIQLAGQTEFAMRFPSAMFGTLLIVATIGLARQLIGRRGALLAGLLVALNAYQIAESQNARNYAMVVALSALASLLFWRAIKRGRTGDWIAYAIAMTLALNTHLDAALVFAVHVCYLGYRAVTGDWLPARLRGRLRVRRGILASLAVTAVLMLWLLWAWPALLAYHGYFPQRVGIFKVLTDTLATFGLGTDATIRRSAPLFVLALLGVVWLATRRRDHALFLAFYVFIPIGLVGILFLQRPMFDPRYLIVLAPGYLIAIAAGVEGMLRRVSPLGVLAGLGVLVLVAPSVPQVYASQLTDRGDYRGMAAWVSTYSRPSDVIVATGHGQAELFSYYFHGSNPIEVIDTPAALAKQLPIIAKDHGVWLLPYWQSPADQAAFATLDTSAASVADRYFVNIRALYYASLSGLTPIPLTGKFDNSLNLASAEISDAAVRPGDSVASVLNWNVVSPVSDGKISLRVIASDGSVVAQHDLPLAKGTLPVGAAQSRVGVFVPATTPPGHYQLGAMVYHADSGAPFKLDSGSPHRGDLILLGSVTVEPRQQPILSADDGIPRSGPTNYPEGISLLGFQRLDGTASVGDTRGIQLLWQADHKVHDNLEHTVEFLDASGKVVSSTTGRILPEYPTANWQPDMPIAERLPVSVPVSLPSGSYTVELRVGTRDVILGKLGVSSPVRVYNQPPVGLSIGVPIGTFATLVGTNNLPASVHAGATFTLNVVWQARGTGDLPYTVFVHVLDPAGQIVAQADRMPGNGQRATTTWAPGEYLQDRYDFTIPQNAVAGSYSVELGMYDAQTGKRLPVTLASGQTSDHIVVDSFAVTRP